MICLNVNAWCVLVFAIFSVGCSVRVAQTEADELPQRIGTLTDHIDDLKAHHDALSWRFERAQREIDFLREQDLVVRSRLAAIYAAAQHNQPEAVPARFVDRISYPEQEPIHFEMVRVPGNEELALQPFYICTTEVTWAMMAGWMAGADTSLKQAAKEYELGLRPSVAYYYSAGQHVGVGSIGEHPAHAMTYLTAEAFCLWLSRHTGRAYRLPTETEWRHAFELGGGMPDTADALLRQARLQQNAQLNVENDPFISPEDLEDPAFRDQYASSSAVGSLEPNKLGIYDMLGNVSEWVQKDGRNEKKVIGGHYLLPADQLTLDWAMTEDFSVWSANYPQKPVSRYWYFDVRHTGLRLVCEPINIPAAE